MPAFPRAAVDAADDRFTELAALATDLAGRFALEPLLERVLRHTMALLGCDSGSICTVDELAGTYRKELDLGVGCRSGQTFPLTEGVTGEVVRAGGPVVFARYAEVRGGHIGGIDRDGLHGVIGVPIRWNGAITGTLVVFSRDPARRFSAEDTALAARFATLAAIAIENARLHELAAEKEREAATAAERERVVRDVHDTVGRGLASVLVHLDGAEQDAAAGGDPAPAIEAARRAARSALTETRRTIVGLGPSQLEGRSLHEAIALELSWAESVAGLATRLVTVGDPVPLAPEVARQLFRIVQESLTNVIEHAAAQQVRVGLRYAGERVSVLVEDDGRGFELAAIGGDVERRGLGLRGLAARAHRLGGTLQLESTPQWGTRVRAEVPVGSVAPSQTPQPRWRVLVVHESPVVRAGLVRVLGEVEPDIQIVGEVADAARAVEAYELTRPDVVVAHLDLPRIDGVQLTSYLRAADPAAAVLLLIRSAADERLRGAARVGAVGFAEHDGEPAALARAIVAAARGDALVTAGLLSGLASTLERTDASPARLTAREREVRALVERGLPDKRIAAELSISVKTVEKHVGAILRKTGASNRTALAGLAAQR